MASRSNVKNTGKEDFHGKEGRFFRVSGNQAISAMKTFPILLVGCLLFVGCTSICCVHTTYRFPQPVTRSQKMRVVRITDSVANRFGLRDQTEYFLRSGPIYPNWLLRRYSSDATRGVIDLEVNTDEASLTVSLEALGTIRRAELLKIKNTLTPAFQRFDSHVSIKDEIERAERPGHY